MLCEFEQETCHAEGLGLSLEELIVGGVGDYRGLAVLFDAHLLQGDRGASDVLREGFAVFIGESGYPNVVIDGESRVSPVDQVGCQSGTDQLLLEEKRDDHPTEVLRHYVDVAEGDADKLAPLIETALQHEAMKVRVPS